ncbi:MAG: DNA repair protein RecN [Verrucomicrobiales bacterium]|nr:DNA repair protein RecN [Verrucomicrobiales bacterium]
MLTTLRIRNLALVADLTVEFGRGLNVLSGETGAGKSVILGALNLVLGQRADRSLLRSGTDACTVEAVFEVTGLRAPLEAFLVGNGLEAVSEGQLILKRTFTASGTNRQFVNGSPTTLDRLATLGDWLVDLHGPHDHQSLLQPARQLAILDAFGGLAGRVEEHGRRFRERADVEAARRELVVDERTYAQQVDLLRFQVAEIDAARLQPAEETELESEHRRAVNAARLRDLASAALGALDGEEASAFSALGVVGRSLQDLARIDPGATPLAELHGQSLELLRELQSELSRYADRTEVDPGRLQQLEERLNLLQSLRRKYGPTLPEILAFGEDARRRLQALEGRDAEVARLEAEAARLDAELTVSGAALSAARRKVIPRLAKSVARELATLGFAQSRFDVDLKPLASTSAAGEDACEFQFAPNPGEPAHPLRAIASSGELARVMLALKTVLADEDDVPVLVFDEVDANVGGETARAVGEKMRRIAQRHQVLCITHLAPVAAAGEVHFVVSKDVRDGRTESQVTRLDPAHRIEELARMLGGATAAARRHAEELLRGT